MNFFKDTTVSTDNAIQDTYYPGLVSDADGIDLRIEMNRILYGTTFKKPLGHWVIARVFAGDEKSKYFNEFSKEGVGGPSHPYTDYLIRARRAPSRLTRSSIDGIKAGEITGHKFSYYLEYDVPLRDGDQIFELNVLDHTNKPTSYTFVEKYDIDRVHPYRLENGNVQYLQVVCKYNNVTY